MSSNPNELPPNMHLVFLKDLILCRDPTGQVQEATLVDVCLLEAPGSSLLVTVEALLLTPWSLEVPTVEADLSSMLQQSLVYAHIYKYIY